MDRKTLAARLRQLQAADMNAQAIYADLSQLAQDPVQRKVFAGIAKDEKRHAAFSKKLLLLLEK
jgi:rubrerythrin